MADPVPSENRTTRPLPDGAPIGSPGGEADPLRKDGTILLSPGQQERVVRESLLRHQFGQFEILGKLGEGGMGVVYHAREKALNRMVALKLLVPGEHATPAQIERFIMEAKSAARLSHPNIVPVYQSGAIEGRHYFTMKYIEGCTLDAEIAREPTRFMTDPRKAAELFVQIVDGIAYAHHEKIIHRDLKPSNVLLESATGKPLIMDFGLAKDLTDTQRLTKSGIALGTPCYMSPEAARGETRNVDARSDLFSLGAMLYEMLAGKPPFLGETFYETMQKVATEDPVPLRRMNLLVPPDLETICMKALEKGRINRYPTADDFAADLRHFLADEPISARAVGGLERLTRKARKHARMVALTSFLFLLLLGSCVYTLVRMPQVRLEQAAVERQKLVSDAIRQADGYRLERQYPKAIAVYQQVLDRYGDATEAQLGLQRTQTEFAGYVEELVRSGKRLLAEGNRGDAAVRFKEARVLRPDDAEIAGLLEVATGDNGLLDVGISPPDTAIRIVAAAPGELTLGVAEAAGRGVLRKTVPRGSYLICFELEGYAPLRVPVTVDATGADPTKVEARVRLAMIPRDRVPEGMVVVAGGPCYLGGLGHQARPQARTELPAFLIDAHEVTNAEYRKFVEATGTEPPRHWSGGKIPEREEGHPVVFVTHADAARYAAWAGKRLPTEAEWEKAARGADGRKYPWGQTLGAARVNVNGAEGTVDVAAPTDDISPYGCAHLVGNVMEWTADLWQAVDPEGDYVIKGGSFASLATVKGVEMLPAASRNHAPAKGNGAYLGFRCAKDLAP